MSAATEIAQLEAAIAEAELTDEELEVVRGALERDVPVAEAIALVKEARDEPPARDDAASNGGAGITDEQLAELDKERTRHEKAVRRLLGPLGEELEPCEACDGMGIAPPGERLPDPKPHEYFQACETCGALGQVLTGSRVAGNVLRPCPACKGRGYLEAIATDGTPLADAGQTTGPPVSLVPPLPDGQTPPAGETAADPLRFGAPAWMGDPSIGR